MTEQNRPLVFDLRTFSLDDGPGIRTTVFLKGCALSCAWCHNPEGIEAVPDIMVRKERCIVCGRCLGACPERAIRAQGTARVIDKKKCTRCGRCSSACPARAINPIGRYYPPAELIDLCVSDQAFYKASGGGVTFSGGEPCLFPAYVGEVAQGLKKHGITVAIETSGAFDFTPFEELVLPHIDLVLFDLKIMDKVKFRQYTGGDVSRCLDNFRRLCGRSGPVVVATIPLVKGITATPDNLCAIAELLVETGCTLWEFRPYHAGGSVKRERLCVSASRAAVPDKAISAEEEEDARRTFSGHIMCLRAVKKMASRHQKKERPAKIPETVYRGTHT